MFYEHLARTATVEMTLLTAASNSEFALARAYWNYVSTHAEQGRPEAIISQRGRL